jgi:chromosome segregation ATPase
MLGLMVAGLFAGACGSSGPKYKVNESVLADLPLSDKQPLLDEQADRERAVQEKNKARADITAADSELAKAEASMQQADLAASKLDADYKLAEKRQEVAALQRIGEERRLTRIAQEAARIRINWVKEMRGVHEAEEKAADDHVRLADARIEQVKANLAISHGRRPGDNVKLSAFDQQVAKEQMDYERAQSDVKDRTQRVQKLEQSYAEKLAEYRRLRDRMHGYSPAYVPPEYGSSSGIQ